MLRLSLLRHAKSSRDDPNGTDHERQLTKRGTTAAKRMANYISEMALTPDLVLCSDAVRTRQTLDIILTVWPKPHPELIINPGLYLADPDDILECITQQSDAFTDIMVIGHNPGLHALALELAKEAKTPDDLHRLAIKYPTAAFAHLLFHLDHWPNIRTAAGCLEHFVVPRELAD